MKPRWHVQSTLKKSVSLLHLRKGGLLAATIVLAMLTLNTKAQNTDVAPVPKNQQTIELGRKLFFDKRLSLDGNISCASCHQPEHLFADARPRSIGFSKKPLTRNAPSLLDVAERTVLFWDGRARSLEEQASQPFLNHHEHGFKNERFFLRHINAIPDLVPEFKLVFPSNASDISVSQVSAALSAYERTLISKPSALDSYLGGQKDALSEAAIRGLRIFRNEGGCTQCHLINGSRAALTDDSFHASPLPLSRRTMMLLPRWTQLLEQNDGGNSRNLLRGMLSTEPDVAALGRFLVTQDPADVGKFRTPTLRDVLFTAPYMHDGSVPTLAQAVDLELYRREQTMKKPVELSMTEKQDLLIFLGKLSPGFSN